MKKEKQYEVMIDVFFVDTRYIYAKNKKEAIEKAKSEINYGMGEELKIFEINKI